MAKTENAANPFLGRWRIVSMSEWDQDYLDEEVKAYIEFNDRGWGEFHFGYVQGDMDCRFSTEGEPVIEWTWDGNDEMDAAQGRGWAMLQGKELHGMIFFHGGDESEFVAKKLKVKKTT